MIVKDLMSTNLRTVKPADSVEMAAEIMRSENVGVVPVCDSQNHLLGLLTDRDIIIRQGYGKLVSEVMTKSPVTVSSRDNVHEAALLFSSCGVRRLPVIENDRLVGMFTLKDLSRKKIFAAEIGHIIYQISNI
jgi:CBS domain-containing protein